MSKTRAIAGGKNLAALLAQALASAGAASPAASDAQKWCLGDAVSAMQDCVERAKNELLSPQANATAAKKFAYRACSDQFNAFVNGQRVQRATILDYASIARVFPEGDPMRSCGLSFSCVRAISRLPTAEERADWRVRALHEGWSVEQLQKAINAVAALERRRSQHTQFCAATGNPISDLSAMVELRLSSDSAQNVLPAGTPPQTRRGGAAKKGRNNALPDARRLYRFENLAALKDWLAEMETAAAPASNSTPEPASDTTVASAQPAAQAKEAADTVVRAPGLRRSGDKNARKVRNPE